jgi:glycine/D-amino acid oxidase-like deaminating enzyme
MKARVVIVGGGILGLSLAYQLCRTGWKDVVVCEKLGLNAGASGRCGGGIRAQWSTESNTELMLESQRLFETFTERLGINIWFRQGGYLFLAKSDEQVSTLEKNVALQNRCGVASKILDRRRIKEMVPDIRLGEFQAGSYHAKDGVCFPFPVLWGYAAAAKELGAKILTRTEVTGIETRSGRITKVIANGVEIETDLVVNACGAWAPEIGKLLGVSLPNKREKHEAIVTEPLKAFLDPCLVPMDSGMYVAQTMRGEIYGCVGRQTEDLDTKATFGFIRKISRLLTELIPKLGDVKLLRQWGGYYDITPDTNPILGPVKGIEGFIQFHGFMGHGFMMAPAMARIMADFLVRDRAHPIIEKCRLERFESGSLEPESMIIG